MAKYNEVLLTASRGQHPDSGSTAGGYMGRDDELKPHVTLHRRSDGTVKITRHQSGESGDRLVVLVLGQYERGFPNYRTWSDTEQEALQSVLEELVQDGDLAEDYAVVGEYGLPGVQRARAQQEAPRSSGPEGAPAAPPPDEPPRRTEGDEEDDDDE